MLSASSTTKTRAAPSNGRKLASRSSSRIGLTRIICLNGRTIARSACSLQISRSRLSSSLLKGGNVDREILLHEEHSSQPSIPFRWRQFRALANSSAKSFLPIPSSPVNSSEPGRRPPAIKRRSDSFTSSLPMSLENMGNSKPGYWPGSPISPRSLRHRITISMTVACVSWTEPLASMTRTRCGSDFAISR